MTQNLEHYRNFGTYPIFKTSPRPAIGEYIDEWRVLLQVISFKYKNLLQTPPDPAAWTI